MPTGKFARQRRARSAAETARKLAQPRIATRRPVVLAVAHCMGCGRDIGYRQLTEWQALHRPTNPWGDLTAMAEDHLPGCTAIALPSPEASAAQKLQVIEALARNSSTDCGGLMALGAAVRQLLPGEDDAIKMRGAL